VAAVTEKRGTVLIVDDDGALRRVISALVAQLGFATEDVASGAAALRRLEARPFDVVVTDLRMPDMDGLSLLKAIRATWPAVPVVLLTAHGTAPTVIEAMRSGAVDFMLKPVAKEELDFVLCKAFEGARRARARAPVLPIEGAEIVGESRAMRELQDLLGRAAQGTSTVLLAGETGTGKELLARAVHDRSPRRQGPFVVVNCGGFPENLLESELFGHEKGAFSGAVQRKLGRVELADKGTLFLDEIGELTPPTQVKLLRLLQEKTIERLGSTAPIKLDVRFVAATHRDLRAMVAAGQFRADLYHRLNVVPFRVPPLREREGDVALIAQHLCAKIAAANGHPGTSLAPDALRLLAQQPWDGNVRELSNVIERATILADAEIIGADGIARALQGVSPGAPLSPRSANDRTLGAARDQSDRNAILAALAQAGGNRAAAARLLGVSRSTLYNRLHDLGIDREAGPDPDRERG
jgi:DNA-binding NtrC family response regulator